MIVFQLLSAGILLGMNQLFQSRFGTLGVLCLFLVAVGIRARNTTCMCVGAVIFVLLLTQA